MRSGTRVASCVMYFPFSNAFVLNVRFPLRCLRERDSRTGSIVSEWKEGIRLLLDSTRPTRENEPRHLLRGESLAETLPDGEKRKHERVVKDVLGELQSEGGEGKRGRKA